MQNINKIQISISVLALAFMLAFFAFTSTASAEVAQTGTIRICSALVNSTTGALASAPTTVPAGTFVLSLATTTDFSSPVATHAFNAQAFAHNTTIDGVPMHCTDAVTVPFGQYYYNNVAMSGAAWSPSKYFDSASSFSTTTASVYTNGLFTADASDDVLINTASDGLVGVNETTPNRTVIVLNTFTPVLEKCIDTSASPCGDVRYPIDLLPPTQCIPGVNLISNGGFEKPVVNNPALWTSIPLGTPDFFWTSFDTVVYPYIEVQAGYTEGTATWMPHSGTQYAEIDGGTNHDVSQVLATIPGNTYILSYWLSPRPNLTTETNVMNVFANGLQIDTYTGAGLETTSWSQKIVTFTATTTQTRISFTQGQNLHTGEGVFLDDVSVVCNPAVVKNTPPTITLVGSNTITLTTGTAFTDSGATASDLEDGNVTNKIVVTGTVNSQVPGTYVLTYTVTDSGGLSASTIRTVIVLPVASCVANVNMIANGGFENPKLTIPWGSVHLNTPGLSWTSYDTVVYPYVEFQAGYTEGTVQWIPHGGSQYAEIDGGTNHDVSQVLATIPGNTYTLSYWVSPRPNQTTATNVMNIAFNGQLMDTYMGAGSVMTDWSQRTYTFTATTTQTRISFTQGQNGFKGEGVFLDDVSVVCNPPVVVPPPAPVNACMIFSDTTHSIVGGGNAVATYNANSAWTASIPGATWIWSTYKVVDPAATTTVIFSKTFTATSTLPHAVLSIAADNSFIVKVNGTTVAQNVGEFNFTSVATYDIASAIVAGTNTITFEVTNFPRPGTTPEVNPAGLLYSLDLSNNGTVIGCGGKTPVNTPPTITLVGANPANLTVGQAWVEPGATANDLEDGVITNKIVITGTVNTAVVGTYPLVYTVTDSGGLSASTTRQVIVSPAGGGTTTGSITFCSIYANKDNVIATSSLGLPAGTFLIKLASTTDIANSTVQSKTWTASSFAPNKKVISSVNDADCVTYTDLALGTYYYSELGVTGAQWIVSSTSPRYNDQLTNPVNNIFDFFAYNGALFTATTTDDASRNVNSDGQIVVSADRREHTLIMLTSYEAATTTPPVCTVNCGGGGNPPACSANCGGGGGGGNGPIVSSLTITNEKVVEITPGVALVTWNTNLPATKEVGYGKVSQPASFIVAPFGYATSTARVSTPLETIHSYTIAIEKGKTYYFRPVSTDGKTTVAGIELVLNPGTSTGTGGDNSGSASCYYLIDWLKAGWNNNPVEVKKLQVFLRDLEGYTVQVTGVYDEQTITALNAFQMKYKDDVLTPWGHTAPTSFTYITTKKKVNEIYCKMAFPVTTQEQKEIDAYRTFLQGLINAGVTVEAPTESQLNAPTFIDTTDVGVLPLPEISTSTPVVGQGTLAGAEANGTSTIGRLTANVMASSKRLGNFMVALFTWPWDWARGWFGGNDERECAPTSVFSNWFNWILVIIILTMAYLWYRERKENKRVAKLNEELELLNK